MWKVWHIEWKEICWAAQIHYSVLTFFNLTYTFKWAREAAMGACRSLLNGSVRFFLHWDRRLTRSKERNWGSPGGPTSRNLPANAGDMVLIPCLKGSHMPWSNKAHAPQLLSLHSYSKAQEAQLLKSTCLEPTLHNKKGQRDEKSTCRN